MVCVYKSLFAITSQSHLSKRKKHNMKNELIALDWEKKKPLQSKRIRYISCYYLFRFLNWERERETERASFSALQEFCLCSTVMLAHQKYTCTGKVLNRRLLRRDLKRSMSVALRFKFQSEPRCNLALRKNDKHKILPWSAYAKIYLLQPHNHICQKERKTICKTN